MKSAKPTSGKPWAEVDRSNYRIDLSWKRNGAQVAAGILCSIPAAVWGWLFAPEARILAAFCGLVLGLITGVFLVGIVLAFVPKRPTSS